MKRAILFACTLAAALPLSAFAVEPSTSTDAAFDRLRALAGEWIETDEPYREVSYRVIAHDAVVIEEFRGEPSMTTFYHLDGDDLFLTHYCGAGNQPRMRAVQPDGASTNLRFAFEDITNLASPQAYHTRDLEIRFLDEERLELRFAGHKDGRQQSSNIRLERRREPASDLDQAFARLTGLVGRWRIEGDDDERTVRYSLTADGSALIEQFEARSRMASVYHRDGDAIRVTHYCGAQNQPRMIANDWNPQTGELAFEFVDVTNLSHPDAYYTRTLRLGLAEPDGLEIHFWGTGEGEEYPVDLKLHRLPDGD